MLEQLALKIGLGVGLGFLAAILSKWSTKEDWDNRKLGFSIITGVLSALTFLSDFETIDASNVLGVVTTNLGGQFLLNKGITVIDSLKK